MAVDISVIGDAWRALEPLLREEKCASCECLQAVLVELRLALDELPEGAEQQRLLTSVARAMTVQSPHSCIGCEPCYPSDILASFYRGEQSSQVSSRSVCCDT